METSLYNINNFDFNSCDSYFFDTNIWFNILNPITIKSDEILVNKVTYAYSKILKSRADIYISSFILSEFFNVMIKTEFNYWKEQILANEPDRTIYYKRDFRSDAIYKEKSTEILELINTNLLTGTIRINDSFDSLKISNLTSSNSYYDFNDVYISELCNLNNLVLVTCDKDFSLMPNIKPKKLILI